MRARFASAVLWGAGLGALVWHSGEGTFASGAASAAGFAVGWAAASILVWIARLGPGPRTEAS